MTASKLNPTPIAGRAAIAVALGPARGVARALDVGHDPGLLRTTFEEAMPPGSRATIHLLDGGAVRTPRPRQASRR